MVFEMVLCSLPCLMIEYFKERCSMSGGMRSTIRALAFLSYATAFGFVFLLNLQNIALGSAIVILIAYLAVYLLVTCLGRKLKPSCSEQRQWLELFFDGLKFASVLVLSIFILWILPELIV